MDAIMTLCFPIQFFYEYCSEWFLEYAYFKSIFMSLEFFFHAIFPIYLPLLSVPIFYSKIVLLPLHLVIGFSLSILPLLVSRIFFHYFGMSCFVWIAWSCFGIFWVFLLFPMFFNLFLWIDLSAVLFKSFPSFVLFLVVPVSLPVLLT